LLPPLRNAKVPPVKHALARLEELTMATGLIRGLSHERGNLMDGRLVLVQDVHDVEPHRMGHDLQVFGCLLQHIIYCRRSSNIQMPPYAALTS